MPAYWCWMTLIPPWVQRMRLAVPGSARPFRVTVSLIPATTPGDGAGQAAAPHGGRKDPERRKQVRTSYVIPAWHDADWKPRTIDGHCEPEARQSPGILAAPTRRCREPSSGRRDLEFLAGLDVLAGLEVVQPPHRFYGYAVPFSDFVESIRFLNRVGSGRTLSTFRL